jgi:hypothetical protein
LLHFRIKLEERILVQHLSEDVDGGRASEEDVPEAPVARAASSVYAHPGSASASDAGSIRETPRSHTGRTAGTFLPSGTGRAESPRSVASTASIAVSNEVDGSNEYDARFRFDEDHIRCFQRLKVRRPDSAAFSVSSFDDDATSIQSSAFSIPSSAGSVSARNSGRKRSASECGRKRGCYFV